MMKELFFAAALLAQVGTSAADLSAGQAAVLDKALSAGPAGKITIACDNAQCRGVQADIAKHFTAAKWTVHLVKTGGMGISGIPGIRLEYCGVEPAAMAKTIRALHLSKDVESVSDGQCSNPEIFLIIGEWLDHP